MAVSRFSRRIVALIGLGIALPALLLAVLGVFLTLRGSREFVREHTGGVILERLPGNPRMYGALEQVRRLSVQIFGPGGVEIHRVRMPATLETAATEPMSGPLERFLVRVAPTEAAPVVWTRRFVVLEIAFIVLMALAVVIASTFGLRYTIRQLELAQLK